MMRHLQAVVHLFDLVVHSHLLCGPWVWWLTFAFHHHVAGDGFITTDGFHISKLSRRFQLEAVFVWACQTILSGMSLSDDDDEEKLEYYNLHGISIHRLLLMESSVHLSTRTHLVCYPESTTLTQTFRFIIAAFAQTRPCELVMQLRWRKCERQDRVVDGSCSWHTATKEEARKLHAQVLF